MATRQKARSIKSASIKPQPAAAGTAVQLAPPAEVKITPGPRKKRVETPPEPRLSNHKARSLWFQARAAWPRREAPVEALVLERAKSNRELPEATQSEWSGVGPTNIGGRMTSIVCDPKAPEHIWAGSAGGGVWESTDAGRTWKYVWGEQASLNIGSLAIDPKNSSILYCGTGEANLSADSYAGLGLYKTESGGKTWKLIARWDKAQLPKRIGVIAIDPFNSTHILVGGVGASSDETSDNLGGLYSSSDSGTTWKRATFISEQDHRCHSVVFHPKNKGCIFATFVERGAKNGIWRTSDGGKTWQQLSKGLPHTPQFGRTSLALCQSTPDTLYAFAGDEASGNRDRLLGVFRSSDRGDTWTNVAGSHFAREGQISYGNSIAVAPDNPNFVICGGVDLHATTDGGKTWKQVTHWDKNRGDSTYAHADHHCLLIPGKQPKTVYSANDGGIDVSTDAGVTWTNRSNGLGVTMYYAIDVAQSDDRVFGGGSQDNGTLITTNGQADEYSEILGGDGGWMVLDPADARHLFASYYNMGIYRFRNDITTDVSPPVPERNQIWMCIITMDPLNTNRVYVGSTRVWHTTDDGNTWAAMSPVLDGSTITAIEVAPADTNRIYVGTENGGIFRSLDGGSTWSPNIASATLPGLTVTRIDTTARSGANTLVATVANFGHSHVFRSKDGGLTWEDIDRGALPDVPHHAVLIRPDDPNQIFVATDAGVFSSTDGGDTWANHTRNLPNVMVVDLIYQLHDKSLTAATYGRSIWRIPLE